MSNAKKAKRTDLSGRTIAFFGSFSFWPSYHGATPERVAASRGAILRSHIDDELDFVVFGDRRGTGRSEAKKKAEKIIARQTEAAASARRLKILDESAYRELVRLDVAGKRFAFFGGFDCAPEGFEAGLLPDMVKQAGGVVVTDVDDNLDYLVLGNRRGEGKLKAQRTAEEMLANGKPIQILSEPGFLELVRSEKPVTESFDFASFISKLYGIVDAKKLGKAMAMLKGESFKLYVHLDPERLVGVVRSQTGVGSVYASWLTPEGRYGCSTPELSDCMGLQGSPCKHLLVLLVGLTRAGQMTCDEAHEWIKQAGGKRPKSDHELAAETMLNYKAAEAGQFDWRPMETIPEDYYAF